MYNAIYLFEWLVDKGDEILTQYLSMFRVPNKLIGFMDAC